MKDQEKVDSQIKIDYFATSPMENIFKMLLDVKAHFSAIWWTY